MCVVVRYYVGSDNLIWKGYPLWGIWSRKHITKLFSDTRLILRDSGYRSDAEKKTRYTIKRDPMDSSSTALCFRGLTDVVVITRVSGQGKATAQLISRAKLPSIVSPPLQRAPPATARCQSIPATPLAQDIVRIVDDIPHCYASEDWQILDCHHPRDTFVNLNRSLHTAAGTTPPCLLESPSRCPHGTNSSRDGCFDAATHSRSHETGGANTEVCPPAGTPSSQHFAQPQPKNQWRHQPDVQINIVIITGNQTTDVYEDHRHLPSLGDSQPARHKRKHPAHPCPTWGPIKVPPAAPTIIYTTNAQRMRQEASGAVLSSRHNELKSPSEQQPLSETRNSR